MTITTYTALRIVEIEEDGDKDSELIILYDETEENYYCYGTRRPMKLSNDENVSYEYVYDYSRLKSLVSLIMLLTNMTNMINNGNNIYNLEIHHISICECESENLDYNYLFSKFSKNNELIAYDGLSLDKKKIRKILKTLTSSY